MAFEMHLEKNNGTQPILWQLSNTKVNNTTKGFFFTVRINLLTEMYIFAWLLELKNVLLFSQLVQLFLYKKNIYKKSASLTFFLLPCHKKYQNGAKIQKKILVFARNNKVFVLIVENSYIIKKYYVRNNFHIKKTIIFYSRKFLIC